MSILLARLADLLGSRSVVTLGHLLVGTISSASSSSGAGAGAGSGGTETKAAAVTAGPVISAEVQAATWRWTCRRRPSCATSTPCRCCSRSLDKDPARPLSLRGRALLGERSSILS